MPPKSGFYCGAKWETCRDCFVSHQKQRLRNSALASFVEKIGIGSALIDSVKRVAWLQGCRRIWLITTNDNTPALRFYQRRGFSLVAVYRNAIAGSRKLKPEIPLAGVDGIPIRDEIGTGIVIEMKT